MRVVCTRGWIFQRIETCVAAPYVFWDAANKRMFSCLYCRRSDWSRSTDVVIEFHVFFPPLFHQFLPPVDDKRIGTNTNTHHLVSSTTEHARLLLLLSSFADRFTPWNLIHCSFRNATNAMARGTASLLHAIFNVSPNRLSRKNVQTAII